MKTLKTALIFFLGCMAGVAATSHYSVTINGHPSKVEVIRERDQMVVPINIPVTPDSVEWRVTVQSDVKNQQVSVKLNPVKRTLRGDNSCYWCSATGKCQHDYPAGSGLGYDGKPEYFCNGTGRCHHCGGTRQL